MKKILLSVFSFFAFSICTKLCAQNIMINVLTRNAGVVKKGEQVFFEVTISNTSAIKSLGMYKIRPQISFPIQLIDIVEKASVLPAGWNIKVNKNGVVSLTNGTDVIPENSSRTILIAITGKMNGGPATINSNLYFSNGVAPGMDSGIAPKEDNVSDNFSSSSIKVL